MKLALPIHLEKWVKETNPSEGTLLFVAAVTLFANMWDLDDWQQWEAGDIIGLAWDRFGDPPLEWVTSPFLKKLEDEGVIEVIKGLDGEKTLRLKADKSLNCRFLLTKSFKYELKHEQSIIVFSYFLGRLANVNESTRISDVIVSYTTNKGTDKERTFHNHILPLIYLHQVKNENHKLFKVHGPI